VGLRDTESPVFGEILAVRATWWENPLWVVTVTLEVAEDSETKFTGVVALIVKSGEAVDVNVNMTMARLMSEPLVPVMVTG
jgi:hypothetical protein